MANKILSLFFIHNWINYFREKFNNIFILKNYELLTLRDLIF